MAPPFLVITDAEFWFGLLVDGLSRGSVYALVALGYTMVYGVLKLINFAHGEVFMVGSFAGYGVLEAMGGEELSGAMIGVAIGLAMMAAASASVATSLAIERIAYRPLRNAPRLAPLISAIGASVLISHLVDDYFLRGESRFYPQIFPSHELTVGPFSITALQAFLIIASLTFMGALYWVVQQTKIGRAVRAVSESPGHAALMGIDVNRVIVITFLLGAALAGIGGVLYGLFLSRINGTMGFLPGIKAFTAAVLGGIGSIPGAVVGGLFLGLAETLGREALSQLPLISLPSQWQDVVAFSLLVLVLIFRPSGIFSQREVRRA